MTSITAFARGVGDARHGIAYRAPRRRRRRAVALTFDDGPSRWTHDLLAALDEGGARGTLFVLGCHVEGYEPLLRGAAAKGHEIGCHGWGHDDPATLPADVLHEELRRCRALLTEIVGVAPLLYRPPFARRDHRVAQIARSAGFARTVLCSTGPPDWAGIDAAEITRRVLGKAGPGEIVCLHDGVPPDEEGPGVSREPTAAALRSLVPALRAKRFELVTVTELLA